MEWSWHLDCASLSRPHMANSKPTELQCVGGFIPLPPGQPEGFLEGSRGPAHGAEVALLPTELGNTASYDFNWRGGKHGGTFFYTRFFGQSLPFLIAGHQRWHVGERCWHVMKSLFENLPFTLGPSTLAMGNPDFQWENEENHAQRHCFSLLGQVAPKHLTWTHFFRPKPCLTRFKYIDLLAKPTWGRWVKQPLDGPSRLTFLCEVASFLVVENIDDNEAVTKICAQQHPVSWGETFASPQLTFGVTKSNSNPPVLSESSAFFFTRRWEKPLGLQRSQIHWNLKHVLKYAPRTR